MVSMIGNGSFVPEEINFDKADSKVPCWSLLNLEDPKAAPTEEWS